MSQIGQFTTAPHSADQHGRGQLDRILLQTVDAALAGCIFVVPLLMGGRQAPGQLALILLAVVAALAWTVRQSLRREFVWRPSVGEALLLAGVLLLILQVVPLPQAMLAWMSPHTGEMLPLWTAEADAPASFGAWSTVSLTPVATRAGLSLLLAYALLFTVTVQRVRAVDDVERLLRWIALSAVLMAGFGLVQLLLSNGKFFGFYEHPYSNTSDWAKGSFSNRNHFAHFLALGVGPLIWWMQQRRSRRRKRAETFAVAGHSVRSQASSFDLRALALAVVLFAGLLSLSRGGVVAIFLAAAACLAVCYRAKTVGTRFILVIGGVALLTGGLLTVHGLDRVSDRMDDLSTGSIDQLDAKGSRRTIWTAVIAGTADYRLLGSGVGSHREVYPMYLEQAAEREFTHAESGPLQILLETGIVGLGLLLAGIGACAFWCIRGLSRASSARMLVCLGAVSASLLISVVHSLADFVWYVPACTAIVALLAGCACRMSQLAAEGAERRAPRIVVPGYVGWVPAAVVLGVGIWMIAGHIGPARAQRSWDRYKILALAAERSVWEEADEAEAPATPEEADRRALNALSRMATELETVLEHDPNNARAHMRLAIAYRDRFNLSRHQAKSPFTIQGFRDAAINALEKSSQEDVDRWLARNERRPILGRAWNHAQQALRLCPLQGEGYTLLAELRFLYGAGREEAEQALIDQAVRVRPREGTVLFLAGLAAFERGNRLRAAATTDDDVRNTAAGEAFAQGEAYWRRAFHSGSKYQRQLIRELAGRLPVEAFVKTYQPDLTGLKLLLERYEELGLQGNFEQFYMRYELMCRIMQRDPGTQQAAGRWWQEEMTRLCERYAEQLGNAEDDLSEARAAREWLALHDTYRLLSDPAEALGCAERALSCDASSFPVHYALAHRLFEHQRYEEVEEHLQWCCTNYGRHEGVERLRRRTAKAIAERRSSTVLSQRPTSTPR